MKNTKADIKQLKTELPSVFDQMLTEGYKVKKEAGSEWSSCCPKCGGNDRFRLFSNGRFWCRQCGFRGDNIDMALHINGLSEREYSKLKTVYGSDDTQQSQKDDSDNDTASDYNSVAIHVQYNSGTDAKDHPYLVGKNLEPAGDMIVSRTPLKYYTEKSDYLIRKGALLCLLRKIQSGEVSGMQAIYGNGSKIDVKGSVKETLSMSAFFVRDHSIIPNDIWVTEGIADALAISKYAGENVQIVSAMSASELPKACYALRQKYDSARIVVFGDNDEAGIKAADTACEKVDQCYKLMPEHKDWCDDVQSGITQDEFESRQGEVEMQHLRDTLVANEESKKCISAAEMMKIKVVIEPIIEGLLNAGEPTLLHADGGIGKSMLTQNMALFLGKKKTAYNCHFLDSFKCTREICTLFLQTENDTAILQERFTEMIVGDNDHKYALENIFMAYSHGDVSTESIFFNNEGFYDYLAEKIEYIQSEYGKTIEVLIIDPLISFAGAEENDNTKMRESLDMLKNTCKRLSLTPIVVHHNSKPQQGRPGGNMRGATAITDWARNKIGMTSRVYYNKEEVIKHGGDIDYNDYSVEVVYIADGKVNNRKKNAGINMILNDNLIFTPIDMSGYVSKKSDLKAAKIEVKMDILCDVVEILNQFNDSTAPAKDLKDAIISQQGGSDSTAKRRIKEAVDHGLINVSGKGKNTIYSVSKYR